MNRALSRRRLLLIILLLVASPVVYYLVSPLFISVTVNEMLPVESTTLKTLATGLFMDADSFHKTSGTAKLIRLSNGTTILRLEDFKTTNGPDLFVYVSVDKDPKDFVNLGRLKGNIGDQNYVIPAGTDLQRYRYVLI